MAGKKDAKKEEGSPKINEYYNISGANAQRKKPACPKCGPGTFMATHEDRVHCGRCGFTEFKKK
jgi:ubiquitin-small subunit ribosomal protein S27Ae